MRLHLGSFVNMYVNGKVKKIKKLSEAEPVKDNRCKSIKSMYGYDAEMTVANSGKTAQEFVYTQNLPQDAVVSGESVKGSLKSAGVYEWRFEVPAESNVTLSFYVKAPNTRRVCD